MSFKQILNNHKPYTTTLSINCKLINQFDEDENALLAHGQNVVIVQIDLTEFIRNIIYLYSLMFVLSVSSDMLFSKVNCLMKISYRTEPSLRFIGCS